MPVEDNDHFRADAEDRGVLPAAPNKRGRGLLLLALTLAAALGAWSWWTRYARPPAAIQTQVPPRVEPARVPASAEVSLEQPPVKYPLPSPEASEPLRRSSIVDGLTELLGRKAVETFVLTDDFARRFVATVDNLGREHAPPALWPVAPTPGRFTVEERQHGTVIAQENAARYTPLVLLASTVDARSAVKLYARIYPLLQQAYRDLGFGDRYLNDRVVEVIDLLLQTPEPVDPPRLQLTEVRGPIPSVQPWVRYEFADPRLEGLAAGQKILVRIGPVNQQRLKSKLRELRDQLVQGQPGRVGSR